jgi:pimeloyl-ACP methyl ester carboxylesterase
VEFVEANGVRFAYLSAGSGPLVMLLHGFPDTAHTWNHVMPQVAAAGYRAVAPFMRGYHPTAVAPDGKYDTDTLGRDVLALIEALAPARPPHPPSGTSKGRAIVVGHDWGASAAFSAAALGPERVRLLVTLAIPHPRGIKPTPVLAWKLRHFITLRSKRAADKLRANEFAYVDQLVRRWSPAWKDIPADETAQVKAAFRQPGCAEAACAYYAQIQPPRLPLSHRLPITVPAVAFAGEHDHIAPRLYEKARHCFTASYEVVQVPGGHFMHREHPQPFATELLRVIHDHEQRSSQ